MAGLDKIIEEANELRLLIAALPPKPIIEIYAGVRMMNLHPDKNYADVGVAIGTARESKTFKSIGDYWDYVCAVLEDRKATAGAKARALFGFDRALYMDYAQHAGPGTQAYKVYESVQKLLIEFISRAPKAKPVLYATRTLRDRNQQALEEIVFLDLDRVQELYRFTKGRQYAKGEMCGFTVTGLNYVGTDVAAG